MDDIAVRILHVGKVSGSIAKQQLLKDYADYPGFKEILQFIYNPYIRTGIAAAKLKKPVGLINVPIHWKDFINHFTAHQTGSDADVAMARTLIEQQPTQTAKVLAEAMATKTLKIGVTETTLNKIYGDDFIPKIGIMRGQHYDDVKNKVKGPFIVTEKLDGARRLLVKENGNVTMYTRSGHVDEGLVDIEDEAKHLHDNMVYDAELLAIGDFDNAVALRQATNAIANSKGKRGGVTLNIFDVIPIAEFKRGLSIKSAQVRKMTLAAIFNDHVSLKRMRAPIDLAQDLLTACSIDYAFRFIKPVPVLGVVSTEQEILDLAKPIWDAGFEGLMLNTLDGQYEVASSPRRCLLKVKGTKEDILKVVDVFEGEGRLTGMLGGVIVDYKGYKVRCGSGFNDVQRVALWNLPGAIIGKMVEIEHFGESKNQHGGISLNCPIFKRIAGRYE